MAPATGIDRHGGNLGWKKHPTAIICVVLTGTLLLGLALPSPWGLGAFESNQPPVWIVSFELNESALTPGGPGVILTVENAGSSSIVNLSASVQLLTPYGMEPYRVQFPSVNATTPLAPRQSVSANGFIIGPASLFCGSIYNWTVSGTFSSGSTFEVHATASLYCAPRDTGP
ncbi:MAG: hypothetical protein WBW47_05665 [Thermoplasmata archaeon]